VGAFVLVHSSDGATQWVGQMNQHGYIFWMLLAFLCLITALEAHWYFSIPVLALGLAFEYMSLWSYEAQILLILFFPLLILHPQRNWKKLIALCVGWYPIPWIYIRLTMFRYMASGAHTYQQTVMRKNWTLSGLLSDLYFNIAFSLEFWKWVRGPWEYSIYSAILLSVLAAAVFVAGFIVLTRQSKVANNSAFFDRNDCRKALWLLAVGLVVLVLSFPVFLILDAARGLWRTQILSGIGAGAVFAGSIWLAAQAVSARIWKVSVFCLLGAILVFAGSLSAIQRSEFHRWIWERHRTAIREVLQVAPHVDPLTMIILPNVPRNDDPFGDNMWFDVALRLVYPNTIVSGIYYYADGARAPGDNFISKGDEWVFDNTGFPPLIQSTKIADTIVIRFDPRGKGALEKTIPASVCAPDCSHAQLYNPGSLIFGRISPRTLWRYNLKTENP
jgi:hypothetical protein